MVTVRYIFSILASKENTPDATSVPAVSFTVMIKGTEASASLEAIMISLSIVHQFFFVFQKRMVDGKSGNLLDFGKGQLEAVRALFFDPHPQSVVFTHGITVLPADRV